MKYFKNILVMFIVAIAIVGIINAIGFMATNGASLLSIIGMMIAVVPAVLLVIKLFKKDVAPDVVSGKK